MKYDNRIEWPFVDGAMYYWSDSRPEYDARMKMIRQSTINNYYALTV